MKTRAIQASDADILRFAVCHAEKAVEEFIWNGLDAEATSVSVSFDKRTAGDVLTEVDGLSITDNGLGLRFEELQAAIGTLGLSPKLHRRHTTDGREVHGQWGRGRFTFCSIGQSAEWNTCYRDAGKLFEYSFRITKAQPKKYSFSERKRTTSRSPGTTVVIAPPLNDLTPLLSMPSRNKLVKAFAFYLQKYKHVEIRYDGELLDVSQVIANKDQMLIPTPQGNATATIIEWKRTFRPECFDIALCDSRGLTIQELKAEVPLERVNASVFLHTKYFDSCLANGNIGFSELDPGIAEVMDACRRELKKYIRRRLSSRKTAFIKELKARQLYPYKGEPENFTDRVERSTFDTIVYTVHRHHPPFNTATEQSRRLTLQLLKVAVESKPSEASKIILDVLRLPESKHAKLAALLRRTTLANLIEAGTIVHERLDTVAFFDRLLFSEDWKARLQERTQLHRLLVRKTWIFGEEYQLDTDDEALKALVLRHIKYLERESLAPTVDIDNIEFPEKIPDLMLTRRFDHGKYFEHLVVELKNPRIRAGQKEIDQILEVSRLITKSDSASTDPNQVRWTFLLLVNDFDPNTQMMVAEGSYKDGYVRNTPGCVVRLLKWGEVLEAARRRYEFFRHQLEFEASADHGEELVKQNLGHLLTGRGMTKKRERQLGFLPAKPD